MQRNQSTLFLSAVKSFGQEFCLFFYGCLHLQTKQHIIAAFKELCGDLLLCLTLLYKQGSAFVFGNNITASPKLIDLG